MYGENGTDPRRRCGTCVSSVWVEDEEHGGYMCDDSESDRYGQWIQTIDCCEHWKDFFEERS